MICRIRTRASDSAFGESLKSINSAGQTAGSFSTAGGMGTDPYGCFNFKLFHVSGVIITSTVFRRQAALRKQEEFCPILHCVVMNSGFQTAG